MIKAGKQKVCGLKIGDNDEVLLKGPTITKGYYKRDSLNSEVFDEEGYELLPHTGGKDKGGLARAMWDFYIKDDLLLPIENGNKKAMCVKMWRKGDFDKLIEFVRTKGFDKFITIEVC